MMTRTMMTIALVTAVLCAACASRAPEDPVQAEARRYGIEILGVKLVADGDVVRLNYRVIDYDTAKRALKGQARLVPDGGDRPLPVMSTGRLGALQQRPNRMGRPQFMLFTNAGRVLRAGDRAVLVVGEARVAGIPVS